MLFSFCILDWKDVWRIFFNSHVSWRTKSRTSSRTPFDADDLYDEKVVYVLRLVLVRSSPPPVLLRFVVLLRLVGHCKWFNSSLGTGWSPRSTWAFRLTFSLTPPWLKIDPFDDWKGFFVLDLRRFVNPGGISKGAFFIRDPPAEDALPSAHILHPNPLNEEEKGSFCFVWCFFLFIFYSYKWKRWRSTDCGKKYPKTQPMIKTLTNSFCIYLYTFVSFNPCFKKIRYYLYNI